MREKSTHRLQLLNSCEFVREMSSSRGVLSFVLTIIGLHLLLPAISAETVFEAIKKNTNLSTFAKYLEQDSITKLWLDERTAAVFAPTNEAFHRAIAAGVSLDSNVGPYHVTGATITKDRFPAIMSSLKQITAPLIFTFKDPHPTEEIRFPSLVPSQPHYHPHDGSREYFVNNAKIVDEKVGYRSSKEPYMEQILYIIDQVLEPFIPSAGISPTANEFLQERIYYNNDNARPSATFASLVRQNDLEGLFDRPGNNTFFIPMITSSSSWRARGLDSDIIRAHVIPNRALFFRTFETNTEYRTSAWNDRIHVGLSVPVAPENVNSSKAFRIQSRTYKSDRPEHHIGLVRTGIVRANIPVRNGVVHLIESPFMVVDLSIYDFVETNKEGQISRFYDLLQKSDKAWLVRDSSRTLTIFAPNNAAFEKIEKSKLDAIINDQAALNDLVGLHIQDGYRINTESVKAGKNLELKSADGKRNQYYAVAQASEDMEVLTVEGGGVNSTAIQADIGATNGVAHVVDKILGIPFQTVYEKVKDDFDLRTTYIIGHHRNDMWNRLMSEKSKRFTFFAPSKAAWAKMRVEMPSEYKQLTEGLLPVHGEHILERHLRVDDSKIISFNDLAKTPVIKTQRGELKVEAGPHGEIYLLWENLKAKITRPDVNAVNGVIHVIDTVLMKKRDMTTSSASTLNASVVLSLVVMAAMAVTKKSVF